ncbi:PREDICTED: kelch-like protein 42 isoform X2 [Poecilia mexicana]|uniref:BTB domain-containing protein n=1 Tax=Poecilia mexicana TaxID=48701 RepID=A0A3B3WHV8_9TELE|nr:PREDICTED: kelch-like protein 42 isoform X2 [Poecilia mexicana]
MSADQVIAIVVDDRTYEVNKKKLIEKSDYFRALYSSGMRESTEDSVQLQGLSVPGLELVLEFINTSKVQVVNETLEDLIETASFLQVTSILKLLSSEIRPENCVELYSLSEVYGIHDLRTACLKYMSCHYHPMLRRPEFGSLPPAVRDQLREMRMKGTATLVVIGDFTCLSLDVPDQDEPWSMLRYGEVEQRWKPLANNLPQDMINVRGYGSAVLDNYLFIAGGYRMTSQEISAVHCYNPCRNEWNQVAPLNQKRSNFKLLAVQGKLYAVGGQCLGTVECYSPEQDWWTCVSSMPDPLAEFSACECQGMIYVMGGYTARDAAFFPPDRQKHQRPSLLPHLRLLVGVPDVSGSHPEAADALGGGHHLPGGRLHPPTGGGAAAAAAQPDGGRPVGSVVQRVDGGVDPAEGEHVQVGFEPHLHAAQRRRLHHEPRHRAPHQPGPPRLPQIQHIL